MGERAAQEALRLDPGLGEARAALGKLRLRQWRWSEAEREARLSVETSPNDATARQWLGTLLMRLGRCDEALAEVRAGAEIDPLAPVVNEAVGSVYLGCGQPGLATIPLKLVVSMYPDMARSRRVLGSVYAKLGEFDTSVRELREAARLAPGDCQNKATLAQVLGVSGAQDAAHSLIVEIEREHDQSSAAPYCLAVAYAGLGNADRVFENLERAYARHGALIDLLLMEWRFDPFRADTRYSELLKKTGLLAYTANSEVVRRGPSFGTPPEAPAPLPTTVRVQRAR